MDRPTAADYLGCGDISEGGRHYPRTVREFRVFFPSDRRAAEWLVRLRWPDGFSCPDCAGGSFFWRARGVLEVPAVSA